MFRKLRATCHFLTRLGVQVCSFFLGTRSADIRENSEKSIKFGTLPRLTPRGSQFAPVLPSTDVPVGFLDMAYTQSNQPAGPKRVFPIHPYTARTTYANMEYF